MRMLWQGSERWGEDITRSLLRRGSLSFCLSVHGFPVTYVFTTIAGKQPIGNVEYLSAFQHIVMPIATEFDPELVIVSAGFDAADGDRIGGYAITPEGKGSRLLDMLEPRYE